MRSLALVPPPLDELDAANPPRLTTPRRGPELLVISSLFMRRSARGAFLVTHKYLSGLEAYAKIWPGPVRTALRVIDCLEVNLDPVEYDPDATPVRLDETAETLARLTETVRGAALAMLPDDQFGRLAARACRAQKIPYVQVVEWDTHTRRRIIWEESPDWIRGGKRLLWTEAESLARHRSLTAAAGLQCNGAAAFDECRGWNKSVLPFYDSRVTTDMLVDEAALERRLAEMESGRPLRLVFSGRLAQIKGVHHLPAVAAALVKRGVAFTMDICGGGPLDADLRADIAARGLGDRVRLRGSLDFERELLPLVRSETDLFVCCHLQGDPSCTYLETFSCGVPIAGYDNGALRGYLREADVGWSVAAQKPERLADLIAELDRDRARVARAAREARAFALQHGFEETMRVRTQHLIECCPAARAKTAAAA